MKSEVIVPAGLDNCILKSSDNMAPPIIVVVTENIQTGQKFITPYFSGGEMSFQTKNQVRKELELPEVHSDEDAAAELARFTGTDQD